MLMPGSAEVFRRLPEQELVYFRGEVVEAGIVQAGAAGSRCGQRRSVAGDPSAGPAGFSPEGPIRWRCGGSRVLAPSSTSSQLDGDDMTPGNRPPVRVVMLTAHAGVIRRFASIGAVGAALDVVS